MVAPDEPRGCRSAMLPTYAELGARRAGPRRGRDGLGRRRQRATSTCRRHRGQRARPRPPGGRRGGVDPGRDPRRTPRTCSQRARRCGWPSGCSRLPGATGRVFFANSGAEANEAAFKIARRTGRTLGSSPPRAASTAARWARSRSPASRRTATPFEPLPERRHVRARTATPTRCGPRSAAGPRRSFLEPMLGEGGVVPPPAGYLAAARQICDGSRRAARARRGPDRHRPHRRLVRAPERRASSPTS